MYRWYDYFFLWLFFNRNRLQDGNVLGTIGFLYKGLKEEYYWWEIWVMIRKSLIVELCTQVSE